ncbi:MAG: class I SAM-dependent methyltransferase [Solobacterium sp.]|jgi:23S rRNA (cytosine1962-C5)-methyltransferase|nr:class I SAM-dependent methyltransferase [Solobacterium sp.]MCH4050336.1 class I SAM-dependent methyltransferase [Solobacterium sp.]MCH4075707.1 class I SAM-dependent methyltransferase [Solobacterium sp.]MCI1314582.1 class I SAM-dependent methyltransferase [Solobacterium sp.]MCI1346829.1 class I SAM-dependent methyltransferase [Solobacterium sp.]
MVLLADAWKDYQCLDAGDGEKLETWKGVMLRRPDPIAMWPKSRLSDWSHADAVYHRSHAGGGSWEYKKKLPESWTIQYRDLTFKVSPTGFKHTGLFPEQAVNWDWMADLIRSHKDEEIHVLNLFAYTGGATMACSAAGAAEVVHVDAAKGMVQWAKENRDLSHLTDHKIRFIVDDCLKFVEREKRRGHTYQGILMDPPSYGRGPNGEMWKFEKDFANLLKETIDLLSDDALFFLINSYTAGISSLVLENMMREMILPKHPGGTIDTGDIAIPLQKREIVLPCGIYGRWQRS